MKRDEAVDHLPQQHAVVIRMRDRGATDQAIAERLAIPVESVRSVIHIAEAKLATIVDPRGVDPRGQCR